MPYIYSVFCSNICFVNNNDELILSKYDGTNTAVINADADFVATIINIILCNEYIILHTITDDIYYYDITKKRLNFLGNYFVVHIGNYYRVVPIRTYYLLIVSDTKIMSFANFKLSKEFVLPLGDDHIVNFFSINSVGCTYNICVSSEKTFVLDYNLNIITTLNQHYKSIVRSHIDYCCLLADGNIDIYDTRWVFVLTIKFKKMISIHNHSRILAAVDEEKNYYQIFFANTVNMSLLSNLVYSDDKLNIFAECEKKYLSTLGCGGCTIIIFDSVINIQRDTIIYCNYSFNNVELFEVIDRNIFISVDDNGVIRSHNIIVNNNSSADIITNVCKYEIKLKKITRVKSAKNIMQ